jgi:DNA-binding NtrC family response regulator
VILHERLGNWNRQLRPRLSDRAIRWFETRSRADLDALLTGLVCPVVLIDLGRHPAAGLKDLERVLQRAPDARALVLDAEANAEVAVLARELGATHVASGSVAPRFVASLLARWVELAKRQVEREGWSRTTFPATETEPWAWLAEFLG